MYQKYKESLVKDDVLNNSEEIITGDKFGDKKLIAELTKGGSNIEEGTYKGIRIMSQV
ncbi:hypothetical protein [Clostridium sp. JS66]|uniref:hypothetical protein n=1 Tax=Clostridium sp. JS66 TaxID=3064705 RepID=UPI00298EC0D5|nr:hypothetical protein [Clostridium sp. JS66]WPC43390.1 hypothetical protein Q6H37_07935 [Clostridium sp. JS66]